MTLLKGKREQFVGKEVLKMQNQYTAVMKQEDGW
jgi:hypothetical protein